MYDSFVVEINFGLHLTEWILDFAYRIPSVKLVEYFLPLKGEQNYDMPFEHFFIRF